MDDPRVLPAPVVARFGRGFEDMNWTKAALIVAGFWVTFWLVFSWVLASIAGKRNRDQERFEDEF
jgi:hypothetical protein